MANVLIDDRKLYPNLWSWICTGLGQSFAEPKVLSAFLRHSGLAESDARTAVERTDTSPWIHVRPIVPEHGREVDARFDPRQPGRVILATDAAGAFEGQPHDPAAQRFMQAKILHELVHWALFHGPAGEAGEAGEAFEHDAYGERIPRFWSQTTVRRYQFPVDGVVGAGASYWGRNVRENGTRNHNGIDVFADRGRAVYAIADGTIVTADNRYRRGGAYLTQTGNYGQMVDIDHRNGLVSRYAHLETVDVGPGTVSQGTRIGTVGASGTTLGAWLYGGQNGPAPAGTQPHLHFEILKRDGNPFKDIDSTLDPATVFEWLGRGAAARGVATRALREGAVLPAAMADMQPGSPVVPPTSRGGDGRAYPGDVPAGAPRGLRNNNPGNLKINAAKRTDPWLGQLPPERESDPPFLQFSEMKFGIRAIARCLRTYKTIHHIETIDHMSRRWAPSIDANDPSQYARNVLAACHGVAASTSSVIDLADPAVVFGIVRGIMVAENGSWAEVVSHDVVEHGIRLEREAVA